MQKTKLEIIEETVEYYKTHERAFDGCHCAYLMESGAMCAVGRCAEYPEKLEDLYGGCSVDHIDDLESFLKLEYRGHDIGFWDGLQELHDEGSYWHGDGALTDEGERKVERLKEEWS